MLKNSFILQIQSHYCIRVKLKLAMHDILSHEYTKIVRANLFTCK